MRNEDWATVSNETQNDAKQIEALQKIQTATVVFVDLSHKPTTNTFIDYIFLNLKLAMQRVLSQYQDDTSTSVSEYLIAYSYAKNPAPRPIIIVWDSIDSLQDLELHDEDWPQADTQKPQGSFALRVARMYEFRQAISETLELGSVFSMCRYSSRGDAILQAFVQESYCSPTTIKSIYID
jgi:hypothetical protein